MKQIQTKNKPELDLNNVKVLRALPLPRLVDTSRGPHVFYTQLASWYITQPWAEPVHNLRSCAERR
jgi:hypothetical protein